MSHLSDEQLSLLKQRLEAERQQLRKDIRDELMRTDPHIAHRVAEILSRRLSALGEKSSAERKRDRKNTESPIQPGTVEGSRQIKGHRRPGQVGPLQ